MNLPKDKIKSFQKKIAENKVEAASILILVIVFAVGVVYSQKGSGPKVVENEDGIIEVIPKDPLKIGFITDAHCYAGYEKNTGEWYLNWRCIRPLEEFARKMNEEYKPDFVIEGGDFVDGKDKRSFEDFIEAKAIFDQVEAPGYHVLGNHETRSFEKNIWTNLVSYQKPYYYFDARGYRIIVLDGNNKLTLGGNIIDTDPENESYPGMIDPAQMEWLQNLLEKSKGYQKVVFVHQPPFATDAKNQEQLFVGGKKLRGLFAENNVRAVFSGHIERMCHMEEDGVNYYVLQGFWKANKGLKEEYRYKDAGVFSEITINQEGVNVNVNYGVRLDDDRHDQWEQKTIELTSENGNCFSGATLSEK